MKEEKEVAILIKLYNSPYAKKGFFKSQKSACIKDFERFLNAPENDSSFRIWIKEMKEFGVIEFSEKIKAGHLNVDGYFVNREAIIKRLKEIDFYSKYLLPFFNSISTIP